MTSFASSSLKLLRRLIQGVPDSATLPTDSTTILDGISAVTATESCISEAAGLGATYPAAAGGRLWDRRVEQHDLNQFDAPLGAVEAGTHRAALAGAMGLSMSGLRASVFLSGPDLLAAQDLLSIAVGRHLPLVIHLACRAVPGHAQALGTGHRAFHAAGDSGCFQLFAINVQEAVDFALIARRVAERSLVPGIVAMDGEQTAAAAQEVLLPGEELVREFLSDPSQIIPSPNDAQRLIYGEMRRQVPRSFDVDRPAMLSPLQGPESYSLGEAGQRTYYSDQLPIHLAEAIDKFAVLTGRRYDVVLEHETRKADIVFVAQGSAVETLTVFADHVREHLRQNVGVLGIRSMRPWSASHIVEHLTGTKVVAVLERIDTPLAGEGPLLRELRVALDRARERVRWNDAGGQEYTPIKEKDLPRFVNVPFGLGGLPLHAADLQALLGELSSPRRSLVYLGLEFVRTTSSFPKHQALMDALRRSDKTLEQRGVRSDDPPPELRPQGATTIAIHRHARRDFESLAGDAVTMIHKAIGGHVRSRPGITWDRFDDPCTDVMTHADVPLRDPGDDVAVDIAVIASDRIDSRMRCLDRLAPNGQLLLAGNCPAEDLSTKLPHRLCRDLGQGKHVLHYVQLPGGDDKREIEPWRQTEALLGGLLALVLSRADRQGLSTEKMRAARETGLGDLSETDRKSHLEAFIEGFQSVEKLDPALLSAAAANDISGVQLATPVEDPRPSTEYGRDALTQAWDHTCVFYRTGQTRELTANPHMAVGSIPPLSSTLRDVSEGRSVLPVFDPATCDADPRLWTSCPDGSLAPLVISSRALIERGIEMAGATGVPADNLRGIVGQLAKRANKIISSRDDPPPRLGELLVEAFDDVLSKMGADENRRAALQTSLDAVVKAIGELPVARTRTFFDEPERDKTGSGELFVLVVNPDACKSPETVYEACEGRGLKLVEQTVGRLEAARRLHRLWQSLPDTSGATIERARTHPDIGPLAGIMLSRHCLQAMAGGDGAEPGSGAKLALRHIMGLAEFQLQPRQQKFVQEIDSVHGKIDERIKEVFSEALPIEDLDALAEGLGKLEGDDFDLAELSRKVDSAMTSGRVEGAQLARLVDVARSLTDLRWRITKGPSGLGRARSGLVIAPGAVGSWAGAFPHNPFQVPVVIDAGGETAPLAQGLLEGQLRQVLTGFRLLRWANLELTDPVEAVQARKRLSSLRFCDLTDEERSLCPPMLVVGDGRTFGSRGLSEIAWILDSGLPVKIVLLSGIGGKIDGGLGVDSLDGYPANERFDLALFAMLARRAFVLQTSIAEPNHFAQGILDALAFDGPAFVHIHAPSPERHGFTVPMTVQQARLAVNSRAFPILRFDPSADGVFGSCLDISDNPSPKSCWMMDDQGRPLTPIDWAVTETRFAGHFRPAGFDDRGGVSIVEYLDMLESERVHQNAYVEISDGEQRKRFHVDEAILADTEERMKFWQALQELAGIVTPFTRQAREDARREVAEVHETEIDRLKREYETRIAQLRGEFEVEATARVTNGLIALAGYAPHDSASEAPNS